MRLKDLSKTQAVNILIALLIGVFTVFPDVLRELDKKEPQDLIEMEGGVPHYEQGPGGLHNPPPDPWFDPVPEMQPRHEPPGRNDSGYKSEAADLAYFFMLSWGLLLLNNPSRRRSNFLVNSSRTRNILIIVSTFFLCYLGIFLNSMIHMDNFDHFNPFPWYLNGMQLFKGLFVFVSVVLFGQLFRLINHQQFMVLENERLKSESLQNRFEALTAQVSPHFFFNALNSLSGLIREKENKKALRYINEISNVFRYILQGNWQQLVSLREEMHFLNAYRYLLDIKYENKLTFNINLDEGEENNFMLPPLSLQPLVENIIKHNVISDEKPMEINLFIRNGNILVLDNLYQPREESAENSGIGLNNLDNRYIYLTGKNIHNYIQNNRFVVELPLIENR